jgi:hypothetical protein
MKKKKHEKKNAKNGNQQNIPVGISRVMLDPQFVDYNPAALGWIYYILRGLMFFCLLQSAKSSNK